MAKPGVMFYFNMRPSSKLSDSERLQLYDAILDYSQTGEVPEFSGTLGVVWDYIQPTLDEDNARYEATREKRAKAGALGGSAKARNAERDGADLANLANASDGKQEEAEEANLTNLANSIQSNSIQSNSVQFNSVTGDRAAKPPAHTRFSPPSVQEIEEYCTEKGFLLDAERFVDYYASIGWRVGKNPMKDWRAAVRTWVKKDTPKPEPENCGYVLAPAEDPWITAMRKQREAGHA